MSSVQGASGTSSAIQQWQYLQSLAASGAASQPSPGSDPTTTAFDPLAGLGSDPTQSSSGSGGPTQPFSLEAMSALIDAQAQASGTNGMSAHQQKVFNELDTSGSGQITKADLEKAFGTDNKALADAVFNKLDTNGDGSISQSEFAAGTTKSAHHHMHAGPPPDQSGQNGSSAQDPLSQLLQAAGASSTSSSNSDGSSTTTITYADGSKVSMTTAASSNTNSSTSSSTSNSAQSNLIEQLIKMQAALTGSATSTSSTTA